MIPALYQLTSISPYWLLIPDILIGVGCLLINSTVLEYAVAQIPISLRGTAIGAVVAIVIIVSKHALRGYSTPVSASTLAKSLLVVGSTTTWYCQLSYNAISSAMFVIVAKRYKLRERERHGYKTKR